MSQPPPAESPSGPARTDGLSFAIFALARAHRAYAGELLRGLGLYAGQELLLLQLLERDGQTQSELLAAVGLDHSTVSKSLKRMQDAGLLHRVPADHDRRAMRVWLTGKGEAMRGPLQEMWAALERAATHDLDQKTIDAFITTSEAIRRALIERHQAAHTPVPPSAGLT